MRQKYLSGTSMWIDYPDALVFLNDNNIIRVGSSITSDTVGARIVVREPTQNQVVLDYWSETNEIVFLLNDSLLQLYNDNLSQWDVLVECYSNSTPQATFSFQMNVYDGKSFPDRSHGCTKTIYWSDINDLVKLQLFTYEGGTAVVKNTTFTLTPGITSLNLTNLYLSDNEKIHITANNILPTTPQYLGDIWGSKMEADDYYIDLVYKQKCNEDGAVKIYYKDCDGCGRIITGKMSKEVNNSKGTNYGRIDNIYKNGAYKLITSNSKIVTIGFSDVASTAYLQDLMYSNDIRMVNYNGDFVKVSLNTSKMENKALENDFEIEFLVNNEN